MCNGKITVTGTVNLSHEQEGLNSAHLDACLALRSSAQGRAAGWGLHAESIPGPAHVLQPCCCCFGLHSLLQTHAHLGATHLRASGCCVYQHHLAMPLHLIPLAKPNRCLLTTSAAPQSMWTCFGPAPFPPLCIPWHRASYRARGVPEARWLGLHLWLPRAAGPATGPQHHPGQPPVH